MSVCTCGSRDDSEWCVKCTALPPEEYFKCNLVRMDEELSEMQRYLEDNHSEVFVDVSVAVAAVRVLQEKIKNGL